MYLPFLIRTCICTARVLAKGAKWSTFQGPEIYVRSRGVELVIANDSECIALMRDFIRGRKNDRIGLVAFSGEALTQVAQLAAAAEQRGIVEEPYGDMGRQADGAAAPPLPPVRPKTAPDDPKARDVIAAEAAARRKVPRQAKGGKAG